MKRFIAAVSFAVLAAPAVAAEIGLPYDQNLVDRALPELRVDRSEVASAGNTRSDVEISTDEAADESTGSGLATGPWANDYHFIAPAQ